MRIALLVIVVLTGTTCFAAREPLTVEDIELLLALKVPSATVSDLARQRGLAFTLNAESSRRILSAGGDQSLIGTLVESSAVPKAPEVPKAKAQERYARNPKDGQTYVRVPAGSFTMGCPAGDNECGNDERPAHSVAISQDFWMGATEVPMEAYQQFARATGTSMPGGSREASKPVVNVTWVNASAYCSWIGGRLPTEAEWEYAARARSVGVRYGLLTDIAWFAANSNREPKRVGEKTPNVFGLFDMLGNVLEWVNDWYSPSYYRASSPSDPQGPGSGTERAIRGGSFSNSADVLRLSARDKNPPNKSFVNLGFRCVWKR
jgi:formylglycine-generating enzyme required for sulfatase activity